MARGRGESYLSTRRQKMSPPYEAEETVPEGGWLRRRGRGEGRGDAQQLGGGPPSLDKQMTDK